ncbi:MAG TPA: metalloregulator ArsR/SmtB family transcription factor [Acidimicrobiales bacterium]
MPTTVAVTDDELDATFSALADRTRRGILARLSEGDATVNELAAPYELTLPAVSKHLKVLEKSGLITRTRNAQFRPCHLEVDRLVVASEWIEKNRQLWSDRFDELEVHLRDLQQRSAGFAGERADG